MPSRGLIQHEWETHGTCSGLGAQDYFATIEKAFTKLQIPPEYRTSDATDDGKSCSDRAEVCRRKSRPASRVARFLLRIGLCRSRSLPDQRPAISKLRQQVAGMSRFAGYSAPNSVTTFDWVPRSSLPLARAGQSWFDGANPGRRSNWTRTSCKSSAASMRSNSPDIQNPVSYSRPKDRHA